MNLTPRPWNLGHGALTNRACFDAVCIRQRLGLDDAPCWVVASEVNRFEWPGYDLRPVLHDKSRIAYGYLSRNMTRQIRGNVREHARERTVSRDISYDRDF